MSAKTTIEWATRTWNPVRGCSRVSPGCDNCYAMRQAHRFAGPGKPYDGLTTLRRGKVEWTGVARFVPGELGAPLRWRKPERIFVNSMSDLFHHSLTNEEIAAVFGVMAATPHHTHQVLTKRPERALEFFAWLKAKADANSSTELGICVAHASQHLGKGLPEFMPHLTADWPTWPLPNVWLGVSVENKRTARNRVPLLLDTPAAVRFLSCEPLLENPNIDRALLVCGGCLSKDVRAGLDWLPTDPARVTYKPQSLRGIDQKTVDWVIVGGESGPGARALEVDWIRTIVAQCTAANVPVFVKQFGAHVLDVPRNEGGFHVRDPNGDSVTAVRVILRDRKGGDLSEIPGNWPREFPQPPPPHERGLVVPCSLPRRPRA